MIGFNSIRYTSASNSAACLPKRFHSPSDVISRMALISLTDTGLSLSWFRNWRMILAMPLGASLVVVVMLACPFYEVVVVETLRKWSVPVVGCGMVRCQGCETSHTSLHRSFWPWPCQSLRSGALPLPEQSYRY
jgi:hypothetical protein